MELLLIIILFFYGVLVIYNYFTIYLHNISEESNSRNDGKDTMPEGYKEISLKEDAINQDICYVGKKIEYNGSVFLILQQDKESVDILLDGKQEVIMIDDITNGKYRIID